MGRPVPVDVSSEVDATRLLRAVETHLISTAPDGSPQERASAVARHAVRRERARLEAEGVPPTVILAHVEELVDEHGLAAVRQARRTVDVLRDMHIPQRDAL